LLERTGFRYDTEPAARAVVAMRQLDAARELAYFHALQEAFYARNEDITQLEILMQLAPGVAAGVFRDCYESAATTALLEQDFATTRQLGVQGFPTLLLQLDKRLHPLTEGYRPYERIRPVLRALLAGMV